MSLTVHFVDREWSLRSFCLGTFPLYENHTGQNLSEAVTDALANWDLKPDQLVATTTDNGSNIVAGWLRVALATISIWLSTKALSLIR